MNLYFYLFLQFILFIAYGTINYKTFDKSLFDSDKLFKMPYSSYSPLKKILELIQELKLKPMKKWSERKRVEKQSSRKHSYLYKIIKMIRTVLLLFSGNDLVAMIKGKKSIIYKSFYLI